MEFRFRSGDGRHPSFPSSSSSQAFFAAHPTRGSAREVLRREIREVIRDEILREEVRRELESEGLVSARRMRVEKLHAPMAAVPFAPEAMARNGLGFGTATASHLVELGLDGSFPLNSCRRIRDIELRSEVSGTKRKAVVNPRSSKHQKPSEEEWSCAICQVTATSEASLNDHLQGKKHEVKLANCRVNVATAKNNCMINATPQAEYEAELMPVKGQKKITLRVDGKMHEVLHKKKLLWCERCKVKCHNAVMMAAHLRGKRHNSQPEEVEEEHPT
ncbi:uncharacterized protein [Typha latifolia]|uniref:uncharacterized protein n=1 Tax=Typha latifolia TaxID=4733 RepID=UPI003C2D9C74